MSKPHQIPRILCQGIGSFVQNDHTPSKPFVSRSSPFRCHIDHHFTRASSQQRLVIIGIKSPFQGKGTE